MYIGLWLLMATSSRGYEKMKYWENNAVSVWKGAPFCLNEYM